MEVSIIRDNRGEGYSKEGKIECRVMNNEWETKIEGLEEMGKGKQSREWIMGKDD